MIDKSSQQRVKRQRDARLEEGWREVRVWVPTDDDADAVRTLARTLRAKAKGLAGLKKGIPTMDMATEQRISEAVTQQGSPAYTTESGAVLTLLSDLAREGDLASLSRAFIIFARAKPLNATFVAKAVAAKVLNRYLLGHLKLSVDAFTRWQARNSDWADRIEKAVRDPDRFVQVVGEIATAIQQDGTERH